MSRSPFRPSRARRAATAALALLCASAAFGTTAALANPAGYLVYNAHNPIDPTQAYSAFATATGRTADLQTSWPGSLASYGCVLLNMNGTGSDQTAFTSGQIGDLQGYLDDGGTVVEIAENSNAISSNAPLNDLSIALGSSLRIATDVVDSGAFFTTTNVDADSLTRGVQSIVYSGTASVTGGRSLLRTTSGTTTFMAADTVGTGTLVALGDSNTFTLGGGDLPILMANLCGTRRATTTAVSCSPTGALAGTPIACLVTVSDAGPGGTQTPTGQALVTVSGAGAGTFPGGGTCTLTASTPGVATCTVSYLAGGAGTQSLNAVFQGSATVDTSTAGTTLTSTAPATPDPVTSATPPTATPAAAASTPTGPAVPAAPVAALTPAPEPTPAPAPEPAPTVPPKATATTVFPSHPSPERYGVQVPAALARTGVSVTPHGGAQLTFTCPRASRGCDASGLLTITLPARLAHPRAVTATSTTLARFSGVAIAAGKSRLHAVTLRPSVVRRLQRAGVRKVWAHLSIENHLDGGPTVHTSARVLLRIPARAAQSKPARSPSFTG